MYKYIFVLVILLFFTSCNEKELILKKGVLDLSLFSEMSDNLELSGDILFYWKQFPLDSTNKFDKNLLKERQYIPASRNSWKSLHHPAKGYGTYNFSIQNQKKNSSLVLKIPKVQSSMEVWINNELVKSLGKIATTKGNSIASGNISYIPLPRDEKIEVYLLVSNYESFRGGAIPFGLELGYSSEIQKAKEARIFFEIISISIVIIISLYHIVVYFTDRKRKYLLFFGLCFFFGSFRQFFIGECFIYYVFPEISFYLVTLGRILPLFIALPFVLLYYRELLPKQSSPWFIKTVISLCFVCFLYVCIADPFYASYTAILHRSFTWISLVYMIVVAVKGYMAKSSWSKVILFNTVLAFLFFSNDLLHLQGIINTGYYYSLGLMVFLILQSIINHRHNKKIKQMVNFLSKKTQLLERELSSKKEENILLLSESVQQINIKHQLIQKLSNIQQIKRYDEINKIIVDLKSQRPKENRVILFKNNADKINHAFIKNLKSKHPRLTKTDIEICSFIKLGLSSEEICNLKFISKTTIKSYRYRIRKALEIESKESLEEYLGKFDVS